MKQLFERGKEKCFAPNCEEEDIIKKHMDPENHRENETVASTEQMFRRIAE